MEQPSFNSLDDFYNGLIKIVDLYKKKFEEYQAKYQGKKIRSKKQEKEFYFLIKWYQDEVEKLRQQKPYEKRDLFLVNNKLCFRVKGEWVEIPKRWQKKYLNDPEIYYFGSPIFVKVCENCHIEKRVEDFKFRKYCSIECQNEAKLKKKRMRFQQSHPQIKKICEFCKIEITGRSDKAVCNKSACQKAHYRKYGSTRKRVISKPRSSEGSP